MPYRIILLTSDKYLWSIRPYAWLLRKYWGLDHPEVLVCGFSQPLFKLPPRFEFMSLGQMSAYPVQRWSDALIKTLKQIPDEVFLLTLEDMWIIRPVYTEVVQMAYDYMEQFRYVARLDLTGDRLHAGDASLYGELGHVRLIWSNPDSPYHLSLMPAFWRKRHLLRVLRSGETPWDIEINGTPRLAALRDECIVLGTDAWPLKNTLAFRSGNPNQLLLDEVDPADVHEMVKLGIIPVDKLPKD